MFSNVLYTLGSIIKYEVVAQPVKRLTLNYVEKNYPSTRRPNDPVNVLQKRIKQVGVANVLNDLAKVALISSVAVPVVEELLFRGAIQYGATWITGSEELGVLTSTAIFALSHYFNNKNPLDVAFQLADCYFIYNPLRASGGLLASRAGHSFHNLTVTLPIYIEGFLSKTEDHRGETSNTH